MEIWEQLRFVIRTTNEYLRKPFPKTVRLYTRAEAVSQAHKDLEEERQK